MNNIILNKMNKVLSLMVDLFNFVRVFFSKKIAVLFNVFVSAIIAFIFLIF